MLLSWQSKKQYSPLNLSTETTTFAYVENVIIYPRLGTGSPKHLQHKNHGISKHMGRNGGICQNLGSTSISQPVAIVTVKTCQITLH